MTDTQRILLNQAAILDALATLILALGVPESKKTCETMIEIVRETRAQAYRRPAPTNMGGNVGRTNE